MTTVAVVKQNLWRHKKRDTYHRVLLTGARLQCSSVPDVEERLEGHTLTIYQSVDTGDVYVRPTVEFEDGRFEQVL